jgi:hypothetical protein
LPYQEGSEKIVKCAVCGRPGAAGLCEHHAEAKRSLETAYPRWKEAYGSIEWLDYLDAVSRNPKTGEWAVGVAKLLSKATAERGTIVQGHSL